MWDESSGCRLPLELWSEIIQQLHPETECLVGDGQCLERFQDLFSASLVCKSWRSLALGHFFNLTEFWVPNNVCRCVLEQDRRGGDEGSDERIISPVFGDGWSRKIRKVRIARLQRFGHGGNQIWNFGARTMIFALGDLELLHAGIPMARVIPKEQMAICFGCRAEISVPDMDEDMVFTHLIGCGHFPVTRARPSAECEGDGMFSLFDLFEAGMIESLSLDFGGWMDRFIEHTAYQDFVDKLSSQLGRFTRLESFSISLRHYPELTLEVIRTIASPSLKCLVIYDNSFSRMLQLCGRDFRGRLADILADKTKVRVIKYYTRTRTDGTVQSLADYTRIELEGTDNSGLNDFVQTRKIEFLVYK